MNPYTKDDPEINQLQHDYDKHWIAQSTGEIHFNPDWNVESEKRLLVTKIAKKNVLCPVQFLQPIFDSVNPWLITWIDESKVQLTFQ